VHELKHLHKLANLAWPKQKSSMYSTEVSLIYKRPHLQMRLTVLVTVLS